MRGAGGVGRGGVEWGDSGLGCAKRNRQVKLSLFPFGAIQDMATHKVTTDVLTLYRGRETLHFPALQQQSFQRLTLTSYYE